MAAEHENSTHLKEDPESVSNVVSMEFLETLGAVATLEEEGLAHCGIAKAFLQAPGFSGEDDGRKRLDGFEYGF